MHHEALVFIIRRRSGNKIRERSMQRFEKEEHLDKLWRAAEAFIPRVEVYRVQLRDAVEPTKEQLAEENKYYCPYCADHRKLIADEGYERCEVCQMSTKDFYAIRYNKKLRDRQLGEINRGYNQGRKSK